MDQPSQRQLPEEYVQKIAEIDPSKDVPVPQILNNVMARITSRNDAILRDFERAVGPIPDFAGTLDRM
jgi:hypothetical protein